MHRLVTAAAVLLMTAALAGCSGSSSVTAPDQVRDVTHGPGPGGGPGGGGGRPQPPPPPGPLAGCPELYRVLLSCPAPDPADPPREIRAGLVINECPPENVEADAIIGLGHGRHRFVVAADKTEEECATTFTGTRTFSRGDEDRGASLEVTLTATLDTCTEEDDVSGSITRVRTRWFTDENGERHEETDVFTCTFEGELAPPPGGGGG
ncbi:MAG TPA: hypothetical protein VEI97_07065 [bacterium]|nr:hypothetical protein [bacterium]